MKMYFSRTVPQYMRIYAHFAAHQLGVSKLRGTIDIHMSKGTIEGHSFGLCWGDNRECEILIGSRQFGNPISQDDKLRTLGHELVHARQYLRRELRVQDDTRDECVWKGRRYLFDPEDETKEPWEVEAHEWEETIFIAWKTLLEDNKLTTANLSFLGDLIPNV